MRRRRIVTPEENDLWSRVAKTVRPLKPKTIVPTVLESEKASTGTRPSIGLAPPKPPSIFKHTELVSAKRGINPTKQRQALSEAGDPKTFKRVARERLAIDATLDLHGMTQDQAYQALSQFLAQAQVNGFRVVLVITGKGPPENREEVGWSHSRGILRHRFLQWAEITFVDKISAIRPAQQKHGGLGAFYVTLRKKPEPKASGFFRRS